MTGVEDDEEEEYVPYTGPKIYVDESYPEEGEPLPFNPKDVVRIRANERFDTFYEIYGQPIGEGKFGKVYMCRERSTGLEFAAKFIKIRKDADRLSVEREVSIMTQMRHPRIAQIYDAFYTATNDVILVMELVTGGELFNRIVEEQYVLTERAIVMIICQICEALDYIHSQNIVHLDIKPENIMCVSEKGNRIKLIDFGLARHYDGRQALYDMVGTPEFAAPEVVLYEQLDFHTDMWSIGVITYLLISGLSPFQGETTAHTYLNVQRAEWEFTEEFDSVSDEAKDFISKLLIRQKEERMLPHECLRHPWIVNHRAKAANDTLLSLANTGPALDTEKLRAYVTRRRFRKAIFAVMVFTGFRDILATLRKNNCKEGEQFFSNIMQMAKEEGKEKPLIKSVLTKKNKRKESEEAAAAKKKASKAAIKADPVSSSSDIENIPVAPPPTIEEKPKEKEKEVEKKPDTEPSSSADRMTPSIVVIDEPIVKKKRVAKTRKVPDGSEVPVRRKKKAPQRDIEMKDQLSPSTAIILGNISSTSPENSDKEAAPKKKILIPKSASDLSAETSSAADSSDKEAPRRRKMFTPPVASGSEVQRILKKMSPSKEDTSASSDSDRKSGKPPMKPRAATVSLVQARLQKLSGDLSPPSFINNAVYVRKPSVEEKSAEKTTPPSKIKGVEKVENGKKEEAEKKEPKVLTVVTEKKTTTTTTTTTSTKSEQKSSEKTVQHSVSGKSIEFVEKKVTSIDRTKVTSLKTKREENGDVTNVNVKKNTAKADTLKTLTEKNRKEEQETEEGRVVSKARIVIDHTLNAMTIREETKLNGEKKSDVSVTASQGVTKKAEGKVLLDKKSEELKKGDMTLTEVGKSKVQVNSNGKTETKEMITKSEAQIETGDEKPKMRVKKVSTEKSTASSPESSEDSSEVKKKSSVRSKKSSDEEGEARKKSVRFSTVIEAKEVPARTGYALMKVKSESCVPAQVAAHAPPPQPKPKTLADPLEVTDDSNAFDFSLLKNQLERRISGDFSTMPPIQRPKEAIKLPLDGARKAMNMWKRMEQAAK